MISIFCISRALAASESLTRRINLGQVAGANNAVLHHQMEVQHRETARLRTVDYTCSYLVKNLIVHSTDSLMRQGLLHTQELAHLICHRSPTPISFLPQGQSSVAHPWTVADPRGSS